MKDVPPDFDLGPSQMLPYDSEGLAAHAQGQCVAFLPFVRSEKAVGLIADAERPVAIVLNVEAAVGTAMSREDARWLHQRLGEILGQQGSKNA